jgi:hypothetical protein
MLATIAFAEACGISSTVATSAPIRRLVCSTNFSPVQFQPLTCQVVEPVSVQQEKISRACAAEKSNSSLFTFSGARPSMDMNQSVCAPASSRNASASLETSEGGLNWEGFGSGIARYANIAAELNSTSNFAKESE